MLKYLCFVAVLLAAACSGKEGEVAPPDNGIQLASDELALQGGKEQYFCVVKTLTEQEAGWVVRFAPTLSRSVHHLAVFKTLSKEPEGAYPCGSVTKSYWLPLYSGGRSTPGLDMPAGAGTQLVAGDQVLMHLHMLNAAPSDVVERVYMNLHYAPAGTQLTPAGIYALGTMQVNIPNGAQGFTLKTECNASKKLNVFAVFPHMHQSATKLQIDHGSAADAASPIYKIDPWDFGDQPMERIAVTVEKGDFLRVTCWYNNNTGHTLTYGEKAENEMCYGILFYTPFDRLDGCIE